MDSLFLPEWKTFIRYHKFAGDGTPLVYLPALCTPSLINFLSTASHPTLNDHRSVLIDLIGSGMSTHAGQFDYSLESHAHAVAAVLDHEEITGGTVIGHSMGGTVGIALAMQRPDLIRNLIVAEANLTPGGGSLTRRIASYSETEWCQEACPDFLEDLREAGAHGDAMSAWIAGAWGGVDPVAFYRNSASLVNLDTSFQDRFLNLPMARTFLYGENSLPVNTGSIQADAPDPAELEKHGVNVGVVVGAGHWMMLDNLDGFVALLKVFI
jgi:pimeloyl-ACP methyl ester carboxylesterase